MSLAVHLAFSCIIEELLYQQGTIGEVIMSTKYIVFHDRAGEAQGLVALARKTRIDALPDGVYGVREEDLVILRELNLEFHIASKQEARQATEGVHDTVAAEVQ